LQVEGVIFYIPVMCSTVRNGCFVDQQKDEQRKLQVMVYSDGQLARARADQSIRTLMAGLNPEFDFDLRFHSLESLVTGEEHGPEVRWDWADLILFSLSASSRMDRETRRRIEECFRRERRLPQALAVICTTGGRTREGEVRSFMNFLRKTASRHGVDFFSEVRQASISSE
jgi:hypothetical protein